MYPVSLDYQEKIKENNRLFEARIQIQHSKGVLNLFDKDLALGTLVYTEGSQAGEEFTIGSTVASDISFTILNKPEYEDIKVIGATVTCNIGLLVEEGVDAHFLQPSQPSKMPGFEEKWEYVPLGRFNIDDVNKQRNTIELKAIDNMIKFDLPYSLSKLSYPATLYQIYINACNVCDVLPATTSFPNMHHVVNERPQDDLTFRDIMGYVAELSGTFAKCNRNGALELSWYKATGLTLDPSNRFDFKPSDDVVQIKGIMVSTEDTTYLTGSEDYAIDLTDNPLLQGNYETVLPNIFDNVKDTVFIPYTSNWQGNMAIQAGDIITQIDRDGKTYETLITKSTFKYRGRSNLEAKGLPEISRGYKGSTNRKIAQIKRKIDVEVGDKLTTLEEQILASTELIANMLGGYAVQDGDAFYVADNKDLSKAMKVWKWGLGGFGYSENGVDGPYTTAISADGSIVAMLVAAGIVTADMVETGILTSQNNEFTLNLNTGTFSFKGSILELSETGLKIRHTGSGNQYSEMRADGFVRKWESGESAYLNDIWIQDFNYAWLPEQREPNATTIYLPERFRNRGDTVKIFLVISNLVIRVGQVVEREGPLFGMVEFLANDLLGHLYVDSKDFNSPTPEIRVKSFFRITAQNGVDDFRRETYYSRMGFTVIVIGE